MKENYSALEEKEEKIAALQKALIEGEESGIAEYSLDGSLAELDEEMKKV